MDEHQAPDGTTPEPVVSWSPPKSTKAGPPPRHPRGQRLFVGAILTFAVTALLYGPGPVIQALFFATICTLGIGLIAILGVCWLVGWVAIELWDAFRPAAGAPSPT